MRQCGMRHADSCSRNKCSPWQMIVRKTTFSVGECFSSTRVTEHRDGADVGVSWGMQPHHSQSRAIGRNSHDRGKVWQKPMDVSKNPQSRKDSFRFAARKNLSSPDRSSVQRPTYRVAPFGEKVNCNAAMQPYSVWSRAQDKCGRAEVGRAVVWRNRFG